MDQSKARRHPPRRTLLILPLISRSFRANQDAEAPTSQHTRCAQRLGHNVRSHIREVFCTALILIRGFLSERCSRSQLLPAAACPG